ncbi:hypothetical protein C0J52_24195 [Blattella germanica]|nr:hypothetical protein C0J52_24195 [Blattella germanica]
MDLVGDIGRSKLEWVGHCGLRMEQERVARNILKGRPEGRRKVGRQKQRWLDLVEEDLKQLRYRLKEGD